MERPNHAPGCVLDPVHWLRHAIAAAGRLASTEPADPDVDRVSAESLTDALAYAAELDGWATVTLHDIATNATLMNRDFFESMCTCGATK